MDHTVYWLWLSLSVTPGTKTFANLYAHTPDPKGMFCLDEETVRRLCGTNKSDAARILMHDLGAAERLLSFCEKKGIGLLPYDAEDFPPLLRNIECPPVLLYFRGRMPRLAASFPCAVIGARELSDYGRKSAFYISLDLARAGATVVSGMARGIDGVALAAACAAGQPCVAVLGNGIDICYPKEHLTLARAIVACGAVVTEYPPGTPAYPGNFPVRNRLISGMSAAVAVVEGREGSGSLITAECALRQGRTLYALPGNVDEETSAATSQLLKSGARAMTSADDIIRDFEFVYTGILNPYRLNEPVSLRPNEVLRTYGVGQKKKKERHVRPSSPDRGDGVTDDASFAAELSVGEEEKQAARASLTEAQRKLYERIPEDDSLDVEELLDVGMPMPAVMRELLRLELLRLVELLPGERVKRK